MPFPLLDDGAYRGVVKEAPSWLLERGYLADASNMIFDIPGVARQRHGTAALSALGAQTAYATTLGFVISQNSGFILEELYGFNWNGNVQLINKTTGAASNMGSIGVSISGVVMGRPVQHFGFILAPWRDLGIAARRAAAVAGATVTTTFTNTVAAQVAANDPQVTLTGADVTTNVVVGSIVSIADTGAGIFYIGRVVSVDTTKKFTVWPAPTWTNAAIAGGVVQTQGIYNAFAGTCGASFQNRLLFGNTIDMTGTAYTQAMDRRVYYSPLPTEATLDPVNPLISNTGAFFAAGTKFWPRQNFFDTPGAGPIVAMEPVDNDELLILHGQGVVIFRGELATQTTTFAPGVTFDIFPLNTTAGCLSDLSVQRTPHGIIWASHEGVMIYHGGGKVDDLTEKTYHTEWLRLVRGSSFAIHGAAYVRNHYIVTGISGGTTFALAYNLDTGAWGPLASIDWFLGASRPTDPSQVYALRWWDQAGAAPSMTNGQCIRAETMFAPDVAGQTKTDADGSAVTLSATSRTFTDDQQAQRLLRQMSVRAQAQMAAASITVQAGARLDSTDTTGAELQSLGSLSNTAVLTISGQSNATPIVITTSTTHGLQSEDEVDIHGCTPNTAANGHWRITVINTTTFSLNGSSGNGATSATGDVKRITEQTFPGSGVDMGQGHYVKLDSSGTVNAFQLLGLRASVMEFGRAMARR